MHKRNELHCVPLASIAAFVMYMHEERHDVLHRPAMPEGSNLQDAEEELQYRLCACAAMKPYQQEDMIFYFTQLLACED